MNRRLRIELYADGADVAQIAAARASGMVSGFTTNPTLMRKSGVENYEAFARDALAAADGLPISFEVFADEFSEMERQARRIAEWGNSVFVKIPITNTRGEPSLPLIERLSRAGVQLNVTAILTISQVEAVAAAVDESTSAIVSVFAGRIADTGRDPVPIMERSLDLLRSRERARLLWASPREVLNLVQADACGCHIITITTQILDKLSMLDRSLEEVSLDTVRMFHRDAALAGYEL